MCLCVCVACLSSLVLVGHVAKSSSFLIRLLYGRPPYAHRGLCEGRCIVRRTPGNAFCVWVSRQARVIVVAVANRKRPSCWTGTSLAKNCAKVAACSVDVMGLLVPVCCDYLWMHVTLAVLNAVYLTPGEIELCIGEYQ